MPVLVCCRRREPWTSTESRFGSSYHGTMSPEKEERASLSDHDVPRVLARSDLAKALRETGRRVEKLDSDVAELLEGERKVLELLERRQVEAGRSPANRLSRLRAIRSLLDSLMEVNIDRVEKVLNEERHLLEGAEM